MGARRRLEGALVAAALLSLPTLAQASPLVLLTDGRVATAMVYAYSDYTFTDYVTVTDSVTPTAPFADFSGVTNTPSLRASQDSVVTSQGFGGSGSAFWETVSTVPPPPGYPYVDGGDASSVFSIEFEVAEPTRIELSGTISMDTPGGGPTGMGPGAYYGLQLSTGESLFSDSVDSFVDGTVSRDFLVRTVLQPGQYHFFAGAYTADSGGTGAYSFTLAAPEPRQAPQVVLLLLAILTGRRRRSTAGA